MALHIKTRSTADNLFDKISEKFQNNEIDTWLMDIDGDFTHSPSQWIKQAWIRKVSSSDKELVFGIIGRKDVPMSKVIYGVYHGRFAEMLLTYFDEDIDDIRITSLLEEGIDHAK